MTLMTGEEGEKERRRDVTLMTGDEGEKERRRDVTLMTAVHRDTSIVPASVPISGTPDPPGCLRKYLRVKGEMRSV